MDIQELLNELNQTDEHQRIEAKTASKAGQSLLETVCAFSNEPDLGGGYLLLGVEREEGTLFPIYHVVGVPNPDQVVADLTTQCANMFNRVVRPQVQTQMYRGKTVVVVYIPEAPAGEKPIFFKSRGLPQGAWRRLGSTDQRCTEDDLLIFYEGRRGKAYDVTVLPDATLDDIDPEALAEYRKSRAEVSPNAEELEWSDQDLLLSLGCARKEPDGVIPTVAGIILFGKTMALRRLFPMIRVDYIRIHGREWVPDPDNRFESTDMRGSLFKLIRRAQAAVLDDLPKSFRLAEGDVQRTDIPLIPARVIREAIVNAAMHRNYRVPSPIQILRYPNRLEIRNAGYSLKAEERLGDPGSMPRNPAIAAVLHETGFAETKGSGIRVMRKLMQQNSLSPPLFESDRGEDKFTATFLFHHFLSPDDWEWLGRFKHHNLTDDEAKVLIFVREVGAINNVAYRNMNLVGTLEASARLRHLRDEGLLEQRGKGSATYYVPTGYLLGETQAPVIGKEREVGEKRQEVSSERQEVASERQELPEKTQEVASERQEVQGEEQTPPQDPLLTSLPSGLKDEINRLKAWTPTPGFRALLLQLCTWKPLRAEELARLTQRQQGYLVRKHLSPMIEAGELIYTIPQLPQHPDQAYRAAKPMLTSESDSEPTKS